MPLFGFLRNANGPTGLDRGRLRPCRIEANCLCTDAADGGEPPLRYGEATAAEARQKLHAILQSVPRLRVGERGGDYVRATATSRLFRFVDDVEFRFDDAQRAVHVRTASRLGRSDLGANRKRLDDLRRRWRAA